MTDTKRKTRCQCGEVEMEIVGPPLASLHCHCEVCQNWSGAPYQWMVLYPADRARVAKGKDNISITKTSDNLDRGRCKTCTSHIYNDREGRLYAIPGVAIQGIRSEGRKFVEGFAPTAEIFYAERVWDTKAGLRTFDAFPTA